MTFDADPPASAAWRHHGSRQAFETVFVRSSRRGWHLQGHTAGVEDGVAWTVRYVIAVDRGWRTRRAQVWAWTATGSHRRTLAGDGSGSWEVDGQPAPALDGCLDVDLESSACTNTFPVHRLAAEVGRGYEAPAAYVRVAGLDVQRLEQRYTRRADGEAGPQFDYEAPAFDFRCRLTYDRHGLVLEYPGIASRAL